MDTTVVPLQQAAAPQQAARDAIARLMMEYVNAVDNDEIERWPQFFTEDCIYQIIPRAEHRQGRLIGIWYCEKRGMLEDRVSAYRSVNVYEPHVYRHVIGPTEIVRIDGPVYHTQTSFLVVRTMHDGEMVLFSAGRYVDEIVLETDGARFRKRVVVTDSGRYDTLVVIPL